MNRCPISYEACGDQLYSTKGLKRLSPSLQKLDALPFSAEELRLESMMRASTK
jgi:serine/threonine-protein kinase HipA